MVLEPVELGQRVCYRFRPCLALGMRGDIDATVPNCVQIQRGHFRLFEYTRLPSPEHLRSLAETVLVLVFEPFAFPAGGRGM